MYVTRHWAKVAGSWLVINTGDEDVLIDNVGDVAVAVVVKVGEVGVVVDDVTHPSSSSWMMWLSSSTL
jgi:hypothetical protein